MQTKSFVMLVVALVCLVLLGSSLYTVQEGQTALKLRLGKLVVGQDGRAAEYEPGLHIKFPIINTIKMLDVRLQMLSVDSSRIYTAEQKSVLVDYYAKWRINDLSLYYTRTGGEPFRARELLTQKINDALRAAIGKRTIKDVVSSDRAEIMQLLNADANKSAESLGIEVVDVRIQGIELPREVRDSVYERMRTERKQVATKHRAQGKAASETIRADTDATVAVTLAEAKANSQKIRADGDQEAATIYSNAYDKDPKFYALYRSLEAYRHVFHGKNNVMVLKPDSEFFKYFASAKHSTG